MTASIVARVLRTPVLAAAAAAALAACSNDPMSPVAQQSSVRNSSVAPAGTSTASPTGDVSVPWYRNGAQPTSTPSSDVSVPWYRNGSNTSVSNTTADVSVPWY